MRIIYGLMRLLFPTVSQSVKEVLQSLVDDGLVQADKIGASNCTYAAQSRMDRPERLSFLVFWSFPSHTGAVVSICFL